MGLLGAAGVHGEGVAEFFEADLEFFLREFVALVRIIVKSVPCLSFPTAFPSYSCAARKRDGKTYPVSAHFPHSPPCAPQPHKLTICVGGIHRVALFAINVM